MVHHCKCFFLSYQRELCSSSFVSAEGKVWFCWESVVICTVHCCCFKDTRMLTVCVCVHVCACMCVCASVFACVRSIFYSHELSCVYVILSITVAHCCVETSQRGMVRQVQTWFPDDHGHEV